MIEIDCPPPKMHIFAAAHFFATAHFLVYIRVLIATCGIAALLLILRHMGISCHPLLIRTE